MTKYEFCFPITPKIGRTWPEKQTADGFEVECTNDELLIRGDSSDAAEDGLKAQAETLTASLLQAMGFEEKQPLAGGLARVKKTSPSQPTGIVLLPCDKMEMQDRVEFVMEASHGADVCVVLDSRAVEAGKVTTLADRARRSPSLQRMLDYIGKFYGDPEKNLAPLYDILQIVETEFAGRKQAAAKLGIPFAALDALGRITNDCTIATSRQPGESSGPLRAITEKALSECTEAAEAIIRAYAARIPA